MSGGEDEVTFRFESPGIRVEFEGPESFVEAQIVILRDRVLRELAAAGRDVAPSAADAPAASGTGAEPAGAGAAAAEAPAPAAPRVPTLAEFHGRARSREGRGALQETILIVAYYLREVQSRADFSISDIADRFAVIAVTPPSNLANTLGMMKRKQQFFEAGHGRGRYALTDKGAAYVRRLIGAQQ